MAQTITPTTILGVSPSQIVSVVGTLAGLAASVFAPGVTLAGMTIQQLTGLAVGVANEVPAAIQAVADIKAVAESGAEPTEAQWAEWNAAADAAHAQAQAAADKVIDGP